MANFDKQQMIAEFKKQFGFVPPCNMGAGDLGEDMQQIISEYHHIIWGEGVIPLKYRYLIALATAVYGDDDIRAKLELLKALNHGATREEVIEVFRQQVWMKGAHTIVKLSPLIKFMDTIYKENTACAEPLAKAEADVALIQTESQPF
ncbi:MAG: Carboxymuconolactone decarboxylase [Sporomusa sp.]|nr:Carboxymuconolactone decarboxylase [Sporomusa sp.]